jgi:hypothetical protein
MICLKTFGFFFLISLNFQCIRKKTSSQNTATGLKGDCTYEASKNVKEKVPFESTGCIKQWLYHEAFSNHPQFVRSVSSVTIEGLGLNSAIPGEKAVVWIAPDFLGLNKVLKSGSDVIWYKHPTSTSSRIPFHNKKAMPNMSVVFQSQGHLYSVKMPSNFPVGDGSISSEYQGEGIGDKDILNDLVEVAEPLYTYVSAIQKKLKPRPRSYKLLLDVASVAAPDGNGFLVRDLSEMQKDSVVPIPVHSMPLLIDELSGKAKMAKKDFLKNVVGRLVARAQAEIYFDFGMELTTPHMQQFVFAFDPNGKPKDFLFVRDLTDSQRNGLIFDFWRAQFSAAFWKNNAPGAFSIPERTLKAFETFPINLKPRKYDLTETLSNIDRYRELKTMEGDSEKNLKTELEVNSGLLTSLGWTQSSYAPLCTIHFYTQHHLGKKNQYLTEEEGNALHEGLTLGVYQVLEKRMGKEFVAAFKASQPASKGREICEMVKSQGVPKFADLAFKAALANVSG